MNPVFRGMLRTSLQARTRLSPEAMDYVLVVAEKPGCPTAPGEVSPGGGERRHAGADEIVDRRLVLQQPVTEKESHR